MPSTVAAGNSTARSGSRPLRDPTGRDKGSSFFSTRSSGGRGRPKGERLVRKPAIALVTSATGRRHRRPGEARRAVDRPFHSQIETARRRVDRLKRMAGGARRRQDLLDQALQELSSALAELQVAAGEVQRQNRELETAAGRIELERRRYLVLFDRAPHGYLVTDGEGVIRQANRASGDLIGTRSENLEGKPISLYLRGEDGRNARLLIPRLHRGEVLAAG